MKIATIVYAVAVIGLSAAAHAGQVASISLERTSIQVPYGDLESAQVAALFKEDLENGRV